jgi:flagellar biosynthesis/type III secretory pathway chaperone
MEATLCREHLDRLLGEEADALAHLENLLDREHDVILGRDADALERTGREREHHMGTLMRIEEERRALCRMLGKPSDVTGLEQLIKWCDPTRSLLAQLDNCSTRAGRCRQANDRNGLLVASRLKHVEGMLNAITGRGQQPVTYGKQNAYANAPTGRMVQSRA